MGLVSIVTPVYNGDQWLAETLASVKAQTFTDWEHLLVDDGSTDLSVNVIEAAAAHDTRITLLRTASNSGPSAARNLALDAARGRFIAFLDADDLWLPNKLERALEWMTAHEYGFIYHDYRFISHDGTRVGPVIEAPELMDLRNLLTRRGFGCLSVLLDRKQITNFRFPVDCPYLHEDFCAWLSIVQQGHVGHHLAADLGRYRLSLQGRSRRKLYAAYETWRIYRDLSGLPLGRALNWWLQYAWHGFWLHRYARPRQANFAPPLSTAPGMSLNRFRNRFSA
jgi:teichuronic acid biosynthesis glycosyltransferase TuaG